jgi:hypothetical protein
LRVLKHQISTSLPHVMIPDVARGLFFTFLSI